MTESVTAESRAEDLYSSFAKREPAVLAHLLAGPLAGVFTFLITHGVITSTQASQATQWIATTGITLAIAAQGFLVRRFVAPAWKVAEQHADQLDEQLGDVGFEDEAPAYGEDGLHDLLHFTPGIIPPTAVPLDAAAGELAAPISKPDLPAAPAGKHAATE